MTAAGWHYIAPGKPHQIRALGSEAERRLGKKFDLKTFNEIVLEESVVPLAELRRHVIAWLDTGVSNQTAHKFRTRPSLSAQR